MSRCGKCCVVGCASTAANMQLFCFPRDMELRIAWMQLIMMKNPGQPKLKNSESKRRQICRMHFEDKYLNGHMRLPHSIPTLFTKKEICSRVPFNEITVSFEPHALRYKQDTNDCDADLTRFNKHTVKLDHCYLKTGLTLMLNGKTHTTEIRDVIEEPGHENLRHVSEQGNCILPTSDWNISREETDIVGEESNGSMPEQDPCNIPTPDWHIPTNEGEEYTKRSCSPIQVRTTETEEQKQDEMLDLREPTVCMPVRTQSQELKRVKKPPQVENFKPAILLRPGNQSINITERQEFHTSKTIDIKGSVPLIKIGKKLPLLPKRMDKPSIRIIKQSSHKTPQERYLLRKLERNQQMVKSLRKTIRDLRKEANTISSIKSPALKNLVEAVAVNQKRKEGGSRWPDSIKSIAINIYKKSPSAYDYISQVFNMPKLVTIKRICRAEAASSDSPNFSKPEGAPSLKVSSKAKDNALSDLLLQRIKRITLNRGAATRKMLKMKILIKGDKNVGKSCLLQRLQGGPFREEYITSAETQVAPIQWSQKLKDHYVKVEAWDVVDKASDDATDDHHAREASSLNVYKNANAVILMMDVTKPQTCEYLEQEVSRVPTDLPVLILGNHCDMPHLRRVYPHHIEYLLQQARLNRAAPVLYTESSMRNGFGLRLLHQFLGVPLLRMQCATLLEQLQRCQRDAEHLERQIALFQNSDESNYDMFVKRLISKQPRFAQTQPPNTVATPVSHAPTPVALSQPLKPKATKRKAESTPSTTCQQECTRSCAYTELLKHNRVVSVETIPLAQTRQHSAGALEDLYAGTLDSSFLDELPVAANQEQAYVSDSDREDFDDSMNRVVSTHSNILPGHRNLEDQNMILRARLTSSTSGPLKKRMNEDGGQTQSRQQSTLSMPSLDSDFPPWAGDSSSGRLPEGGEDRDIAKKVKTCRQGDSEKVDRKRLKKSKSAKTSAAGERRGLLTDLKNFSV